MSLTRIAALPGSGAGAMAAWHLEEDPPKPKPAKAEKPAAPSMAHLDVDPARMPILAPWTNGNPPPPPSKRAEDWADYLVSPLVAEKQAGQAAPMPPRVKGESFGDYLRRVAPGRIHDIRDPGHNHGHCLGEIQLRVDKATFAAIQQAGPAEVQAMFQDACAEMAKQIAPQSGIDQLMALVNEIPTRRYETPKF